MQIPGRFCTVCNERIALAGDGQGCAVCAIAWHLDCRDDARTCPTCGADVRQVALQEEKTVSDSLTGQVRTGRLIYRGVLLLYCAVYAIAVAAFLARSEMPPYVVILESAARLVIFSVFWTYAYTGSAGARKFLGFSCSVGIFFAPATLAVSLTFFVASTATMVFTIWACWFSSYVKAYESSRRPP